MRRGTLFMTLCVALSIVFTGSSFSQMHDHSRMQSTDTGGTEKSVFFVTPPAFKIQLDTVYKSYLSVNAALSSDDFQNAQTNALILAKSLKEVDMKLLTDMKAHMAWMASSEKLAKDSESISTAPDIETARAGFKQASDDLIVIAKQFGTSEKTTLYVFHCPMALKKKGADWIQSDKTVNNPYFGKSMLSCGKVTEIIEPKN